MGNYGAIFIFARIWIVNRYLYLILAIDGGNILVL